MAFPSTLSTFNRPTPTDRLNSPSHSALHNTVSSALGQVEAVIGVEGSASVVGSLQYLIKSPASNGGGHVQGAAFGGTGQTTFTKGNLLVAQSASVLSKLAIGGDGAQLVADSTQPLGVKWGGAGNVQSFIGVGNGSIFGTWIYPSLISATSRTFIELWGGGGSGGHQNAGTFTGGGGGGAYNSGWFVTSALGASQQILVGGGGASVLNGAGQQGGDTIFMAASTLVAYGGGGGGFGGNNGGSGGGPMSAGVAAGPNSVLGGLPGAPFSGYGGFKSSVGGIGISSGGGAGGGGTAGGNTLYGGAGGGGIMTNPTSIVGTGGISQLGGNGGGGRAGASGIAGSIPSGGGGASVGNGFNSGQGGAGKAIITTFI